MSEEEELVTIAEFDHLSEAEVARSLLEAQGISAFVADADVVNMEWLSIGAVQHFELQVARSRAERAIEIVNTKQELPAGEEEEPSEEGRCPACGADLTKGSARCARCGWTYDQGPGGTRAIG